MKYAIIVLILGIGFATEAKADVTETEAGLHFVAHAGATYAITHGGEVLCTKLTSREHKLACTIGSALVANGINVGRKVAQGMPSDTKRATIAGIIGSGFAVTFISLDW